MVRSPMDAPEDHWVEELRAKLRDPGHDLYHEFMSTDMDVPELIAGFQAMHPEADAKELADLCDFYSQGRWQPSEAVVAHFLGK